MTDIMKLAEAFAYACADVREFLGANAGMDEADGLWIASKQARAALQSAIEALQSKLGDAIQSSAHWQHQFTEAQAENERLQSALAQCRDAFPIPAQGSPLEQDWAAAMGEPESVPDFVKASVDAMGKGEPVGVVIGCDVRFGKAFATLEGPTYIAEGTNLYAAHKTLAPLTQQQRMAVWNDVKSEGYGRWEFSFDDVVDAVEKAHGIGGTP